MTLRLSDGEVREAVHTWLLARGLATDANTIRLRVDDDDNDVWVEAQYTPLAAKAERAGSGPGAGVG